VCVAALLAALGCAREGPQEPSDLLRGVESADIGAVKGQAVLSWRLSETPRLRVGGDVDDPAHHFVEVVDAEVLPGGSLLVADGQSGVVRRYGPQGDFVGQLGAVGEGPGEFRYPASIALISGDSLAVWDQALWRVSVFGEGGFVRGERYDPTAAGLYPMEGMWPAELRLARDGTRLVRLISKDADKGGDVGRASPRAGLGIHLVGAPAPQLLSTFPSPEEVEVEAPWGTTMLVPPLSGVPAMAYYSPDNRACFGHQSTREVLCTYEDGRRAGLRWTDDPRLVDPMDSAILGWRSATVAELGGKVGDRIAEEVVAQVPIPALHPAFGNLLFDSLGYLWVDLGPVDGSLLGREYLVLDGALGVAGRLKIPNMKLLRIGADYLLGIQSNALGVQEVVVFDLLR